VVRRDKKATRKSADIVGTRIYDASTARFRIEKGPIFTNILLADEINRATPKTQSGLLEAMQERQVTLADTTFRLDDPFWVLATQNPVEHEGVYSLPEAQLDRFSMMLTVDYPAAERERHMLQVNFQRVELERQVSPSDVARPDPDARPYQRPRAGVHRPDRTGDAGSW